MLARDYCTDPIKPVVLGHHMLIGMKQGQAKMAKSVPDSAIFMEDTEADVQRKVKKAFCPEQVVAENPVIEYAKYIIFPSFGDEMTLDIKTDKGTEKRTYKSFSAFEADYLQGAIHPNDLKPAVASYINRLLQPVRAHFKNDPYARQLLEAIKRWQQEGPLR